MAILDGDGNIISGSNNSTTDSFWRQTNATSIAGGPDTDNNMGVVYPKLKFNFTVQFILRDKMFDEVGNTEMAPMMFHLKTASRPKPKITYEDVNFYNFRTKVAKNMDYGELTLSFYDDPHNYAHDIITGYFSTVSPVFGKTDANGFDNSGQNGTASIGVLQSNRHGPIKSIQVTQYFGWRAGVVKSVQYEYFNPKIVSADMDDLDMTVSEFNIINATFVYDTFNVTKS